MDHAERPCDASCRVHRAPRSQGVTGAHAPGGVSRLGGHLSATATRAGSACQKSVGGAGNPSGQSGGADAGNYIEPGGSVETADAAEPRRLSALCRSLRSGAASIKDTSAICVPRSTAAVHRPRTVLPTRADRAADGHPRHYVRAEFGDQSTEQSAGEQPKLSRPRRRFGGQPQLAVAKAHRLAVCGDIRADQRGPVGEDAGLGDRSLPAALGKQSGGHLADRLWVAFVGAGTGVATTRATLR